MRAIRLEGRTATVDDIRGRVLVHDLGPRLRKGTVLGEEHLDQVRQSEEIHVVELEPGDLHEDEAGRRLAAALARLGPLRVDGPAQSQYRLVAAERGQLRVNAGLVGKINALSGIALFTLYDGQAVDAGEEVAGCKVTPVAVPEQVVREAAYMALEFRVLELAPFLPLRTAIVVTEKLKPNARALFAGAVKRKLGWYGAEVLGVEEVARARAAVAAAYAHATEAGAELIRFGMPAHPGSMLWMGRLGPATILGIASCAGFGRNTSLDLVLPYVFSGSPVDLAGLGHGGLIEAGAGRRFPPYP